MKLNVLSSFRRQNSLLQFAFILLYAFLFPTGNTIHALEYPGTSSGFIQSRVNDSTEVIPHKNLKVKIRDLSGKPYSEAVLVLLQNSRPIDSCQSDTAGVYHFKIRQTDYYSFKLKKIDGFESKQFYLKNHSDTSITLILDLLVLHKRQKMIVQGRTAAHSDVSQSKSFHSIAYTSVTKSSVKRGKKAGRKSAYKAPKPKKRSSKAVIQYSENSENYNLVKESDFITTKVESVSTFSIDVDQASYTNTRRMINQGSLPESQTVRIEEMINYFRYNYPNSQTDTPFVSIMESAICPWNTQHRIVHIGIKGKVIKDDQQEANNLVFLIDVSGSMSSENKLPLVVRALKNMVRNLKSEDQVAIVVYAGNSGLVLPATSCEYKNKILEALDKLSAGGSTAGGAGIQLAYKVALENFKENGNNRVILITDGDFNVGISGQAELKTLIEEKRKSNVFLTVCGVGMGNYKDDNLETLADAGDGNYYYIDSDKEADKIFTSGLAGVLHTVAKDMKIQIEFNPAFVQAYRLIGYENRQLNNEDFENDKVDAGELGSGQTVTVIYEIIPPGVAMENQTEVKLKYQKKKSEWIDCGNEMLTLKIRYKTKRSFRSTLYTRTLDTAYTEYSKASDNLKLSSSVCIFGMLLNRSKHMGESNYKLALDLLASLSDEYKNEDTNELVALIEKAKKLKR